ncbi:MAG: O-methyltransferase, partial [bacterium]
MAKMEDGFGKPEEVRVFVEANAECGNPASVLAALDRYAEDYFFLMNVGPEKGPLLTAEVEKVGPAARIIELGSYCGYSAVLIAQRLGPDGHL